MTARGYPANETLKLIEELGWTYVFAMPRTRKFTNGKHVRDLVQHLPKSRYCRRATSKPDGKRQDYWVYLRHAALNKVGDVTIVLSKKRRNFGPNRVKIIVTNRLDVSASAVISQYSIRWGVEVAIKELKSGLHLGRMQLSQNADRVERSVILPVCAYLLLVHLHGRDQASALRADLFIFNWVHELDVLPGLLLTTRTNQGWHAPLVATIELQCPHRKPAQMILYASGSLSRSDFHP